MVFENNSLLWNKQFENLFNDASNSSHNLPYLQLWAKTDPYKQLLAHMIDVGSCVIEFLSAKSSVSYLDYLVSQWHCDRNTAIRFTAYLAAMHDIGKAMPCFQSKNAEWLSKCPESVKVLFRESGTDILHEFASKQIFNRVWKERSPEDEILRLSYATVLSMHHQRNEQLRVRIPDEWQEIQNQIESVASNCFYEDGILPVPDNINSVCYLLTGIIILCDYVASSGPFSQLQRLHVGYTEKSLETAHTTLRKYGLVDDSDKRIIKTFSDVFPGIAAPRPIQKKCETLDVFSPLTIIEAPMGEGKTEAALYLAERMCQASNKRGIYVALPTQATSNQMYSRVNAMLETLGGHKSRLMHGAAFMMDTVAEDDINISTDNPEAEKWLGSSLRMGLFDQNGVGTVDQVMASVLRMKFSPLRMAGLFNKILIIDELHAYDAYMSKIIQSLLKWCHEYKVQAIVLSATLQKSQKASYLSCYKDDAEHFCEEKEPYPLITQISNDGTIRSYATNSTMEAAYKFKIVPFGDNCEAIANYTLDKVRNGGCYCVLLNTIKKAQAVYRILLEKSANDEELDIALLHAKVTVGEKAEAEKKCLEKYGRASSCRPQKSIVVATQVLEQSLDLDFDGMITDLAPIDSLLQRIGRVHRHRLPVRPDSMKLPEIAVIIPAASAPTQLDTRYGSSGHVYYPFLLFNTEQLIKKYETINVPNDVRTVIEAVYGSIDEKNMKAWRDMSFSQDIKISDAAGNIYPDPNENNFYQWQASTFLTHSEVDDGFEPGVHATTRLGEPTFRLAFVGPAVVKSVASRNLDRSLEKSIYMHSVALPMRKLTDTDFEDSGLSTIEKGVLKGCYLSKNTDRATVGKMVFINDPSLGIITSSS